MKFIQVLFLACVLTRPAMSEMFTALVHMEGLVELEEDLAGQLRNYIQKEKNRLTELEK